MSKKTKKEKIIAAYRKQLRLLHEQQPILQEKKETPEEKAQAIPEKKAELPKYFFADFRKSLIFIIIIIALEIGLYFVKLLK